MGRGQRKKIEHHLPEEKIDEMLREAEDDDRLRHIGFVKNLYQGDTIPEAADRHGRSPATGNRWAEDWNEGGFAELMSSYGGRRPPKLGEDEQDELLELLCDGQPWKSQEIQHLLHDEFDVEHHPDYLGKFLRDLGLSYAKPRPKRPNRPDNPDEILEERVDDVLDGDDDPHNMEDGDDEDGWVVDEDVCTDGGTVIGFLDASQPQPYDNSRRVWYVNDPHVERPLVKTEDSMVGFYALNGESLVRWTEDETKERICEVLELVREQNPGKRILLVLDKHGSHICEYTRKRAHQLWDRSHIPPVRITASQPDRAGLEAAEVDDVADHRPRRSGVSRTRQRRLRASDTTSELRQEVGCEVPRLSKEYLDH